MQELIEVPACGIEERKQKAIDIKWNCMAVRWKEGTDMRQILCFGDSNTYGLIPGTADRYSWGTRWTSILDEKLQPYGYRVAEEGLCGRTTMFADASRPGRSGIDLLPTILETHRPLELVVLMLGTNDCKRAYQTSPEKIGVGIEKLLDQIRKEREDLPVLLVSPIHLGDDVERFDPEFDRQSVETSKGLKEVYERIARRRGISFLAASDHALPGEKDQEHMTKDGHRELAEAVFEKVKEILPEQKDARWFEHMFCA